jgi:hypothetical protein
MQIKDILNSEKNSQKNGMNNKKRLTTKAIRNAGFVVNLKIMQVIKFNYKLKVKCFKNPHYA